MSGMLAAAGLNAGLLIGRDDELIFLQGFAFPLTAIQIQNASRLGGKIRIPRKNPTPVIPGPNGILMQPAPKVIPLTEATRPLC